MKKRMPYILSGLLIVALFLQGLPFQMNAVTANPTSTGLVDFAYKALNEKWGYVYGSTGQVMTQSIIDAKASKYPSVYETVKDDGRTTYEHAVGWIGDRAADCSGLIKSYLWWNGDDSNPGYVSSQDQSSGGMYDAATVKGTIDTIPNIHGLLVWKSGHIGIYVGNGEVIEARGVAYGVVKTKLADRTFTNWCKYAQVTYPSDGLVTVNNQEYLYVNGVYVTGLQVVNGKAYWLGTDGVRQTGFQAVGSQIRYFAPDGSILTGWQAIDGSTYYLDASSNVLTGWQTIAGQRYYFSARGVLQTGWRQVDSDIYYFQADGTPATGLMAIDTVQTGGTQTASHLFNDQGVLLTGWQETASGTAWRTRAGTTLNGLQLIGDQYYYLDLNGIRQTGWQTIAGKSYYFDLTTGVRSPGGRQVINNQTLVLAADGARPTSRGLVFANNTVYLTDAKGLALSGTQSLAVPVQDGVTVTQAALQLAADTNVLQPASSSDYMITKQQLTLTLAEASAASVTYQLTTSGTAPAQAEWFSLDPAVATVDQAGLVTSVGSGRTLIISQGSDGTYAACLLTVLPDPASLALTAKALTVEPGMAATLPVTGLPAELLDAYTLTSSDTAIVTALADGRQQALASGTATVSLIQGDATLLSWTVNAEQPLLGIALAAPTLQLTVNQSLAELAALVPASGTGRTLSYQSDNKLAVTVSSAGTVTGKTRGQAAITVIAGDQTAGCAVTVTGQLPTLQRGSSGTAVKTMQQKLIDLGYMVNSASSTFGPQTEFAVYCLQKNMGLTLNGMADDALQMALLEGSAPAATATKTANQLTGGDKGEAVYILQKRLFHMAFLKANFAGSFGSLTVQAVKTSQVLNDRSETGVVTLSDISSLFGTPVEGSAILESGDSGYEVLILQKRLAALGYYGGAQDSSFSDAVAAAVKSFQTSAGLTANGIAGYVTQTRLYSSSAPVAPTPVPTAAPTPTPNVTPTPAAEATPTPVPEATPTPAAEATPTPVPEATPTPVPEATPTPIPEGDKAPITPTPTPKPTATPTPKPTATPTPKPTATPTPIVVLKLNSKSTAVKTLEKRLVSLGYHYALPTTLYDSLTVGSVKTFQKRAGLTVTGTADVKTQTALNASSAPRSNISYKEGSSGTIVKRIQDRLIKLGYLGSGYNTSSFGPKTTAAVKAFQKKAGLTVDGKVGSKTVARLFSTTAPLG